MTRSIRLRRCPSDGELRETLEATQPAVGWVPTHVERCVRCQVRLAEIAENAELARMSLGLLSKGDDTRYSAAALERFHARRAGDRRHERYGSGGMDMLQNWGLRVPRMAAAIGAALAIVLVLSLSPMRTLADDFLNQFRVQKFAAITIPMDAIAPMQMMFAASMDDAEIDRIKTELDMLGTIETTFGFDHETKPAPVTLDEARQAYGSFLVPSSLPDGFSADPVAYVTEAGTASYTMDVERANELVREIGLPIFSLPDPDVYPTVTFTLNAPAAVGLMYTNTAGDMLVTGQMESPSLSIPDGVDMDALREDVLRFPGLPTDLVAELRSIDDWENTLIIPIPDGAASRDVTVQGQPGLLIESDEGSVVLWEKSGILYGVGGQVDGDVALDVAASLK